jgi:hypothetical protein
MSYREKFAASEERAHYQNIATKILRELSDLRSRVESSPNVSKRWIWELIQNAKDVHIGGRVKVRIEVELDGDDPHVTFRHSGQPFSADNIRFLIEQISTKDRKKDETGRQRTTGKFGTGFLTTHLLSEVVTVQGIAKEPGLPYRGFDLLLDRTGFDLEEITEAVKTAKQSVEDLDDRPTSAAYVSGAFNTAFRYTLTDSLSRKVAKAGLEDLDICLPYTLVFVREIESVEVSPRSYSLAKGTPVLPEADVAIVSTLVQITRPPKDTASHLLAVLRKGFTTIAIPVSVSEDVVTLIRPGPDVPRLFCDFPLLGTETFPFPVIVNNPNFNPTDPRDGVFLTTSQRINPLSEENKAIIREAVTLYLDLLNHASDNSWDNLHSLVSVRPAPSTLTWVDASWYKNDVLTPVRRSLLHAKIVRTATDDLASILSDDGQKFIWIPSGSKKQLRDKIWLCCSSWFPSQLPTRSDVEVWHEIAWEDCGKLTVATVAEFVEKAGTLSALAEELVAGTDVHGWLNAFYALLRLDEDEYDLLINKRSLFPNQNGDFRKKSELYRDAGNIGEPFKDILKLLGDDLRAELLLAEVDAGLDDLEVRDQAYAVKEITSSVQDKANDREVAKSFRPAFRKILLWFRDNKARANKLFPVLYRQKHLLYDDEEISENIERAEQLGALLTEYKVGTVDQLRAVLAKQLDRPALLPITEEILASMGITSVAEWTKALKDTDVAVLFSHKSTPTTDMFVYAQSLIARAKEAILAHLRALENYDVTGAEETAPTVFAGIFKDGRELTVVARPAYDGEVIIYYGSERDVLDFEDSELWIDDGAQPRRVTLGHLLKTTQIRRFPV